jgi:phosphoglycolate phosphatase
LPLIMFDMDGTLIDTHGLISEHMATAFTGNGLPEPTPGDVRQIIGLSLPIAIARLSRSDDVALVDRVVESYRTAYRESLEHHTDREPLYPGVREALDRLRSDPATLLGIATGKGLTGVHRILGNHGLAGHFVTLQTPDHNPSKPDPAMLLSAMKATGMGPNETIMIGDTVFDIELAVNAGCQAVGVTWGYHDPADLLSAGAGAMIDSYDELDAAIARLLE